MAQFSRIEVAQTMKSSGMVPLFYNNDINTAKKILKACYNGGARLMEFTNRGDFALEVFAALNKYAINELPGMIMGVGSVTDAGSASAYSTAVPPEPLERKRNREESLSHQVQGSPLRS